MHIFGRTSIIGFLAGLSVLIIPFESRDKSWNSWINFIFSCFLHWVTCQIISIFNLYKGRRYSWRIESHIIFRSYLLGFGCSIGQLLVWKDLNPSFGWYLSVLCFFHYSEFLVTSIISPSTLSLDSFLLNHSKEYGIAAAASWLEFAIELYTVPWLKSCPWPMRIGLFFCIAGEILRKGAMLTAWSNFTHLVREKRIEGHQLVTHGLYSLCRHPSYAGWFWWSIGTQVVLMNPICTVGYALASWKFFYNRILYEEATLLQFFGHKYFQYQHKVKRTGVPFVSGYVLHQQLRQNATSKSKSKSKPQSQSQYEFKESYDQFHEEGYANGEEDDIMNMDIDNDIDNTNVSGNASGNPNANATVDDANANASVNLGENQSQSQEAGGFGLRKRQIGEELNFNQFIHIGKEGVQNEPVFLNGGEDDDSSIDDEVEEAIRLSSTRKLQLTELLHRQTQEENDENDISSGGTAAGTVGEREFNNPSSSSPSQSTVGVNE